jgi:hypothetical protein
MVAFKWNFPISSLCPTLYTWRERFSERHHIRMAIAGSGILIFQRIYKIQNVWAMEIIGVMTPRFTPVSGYNNVSEDHNASMLGVNPRCHESQHHNMNCRPVFFFGGGGWKTNVRMSHIGSLDHGNQRHHSSLTPSVGVVLSSWKRVHLWTAVCSYNCFLTTRQYWLPMRWPKDASQTDKLDVMLLHSLASTNWNWRTQQDAMWNCVRLPLNIEF